MLCCFIFEVLFRWGLFFVECWWGMSFSYVVKFLLCWKLVRLGVNVLIVNVVIGLMLGMVWVWCVEVVFFVVWFILWLSFVMCLFNFLIVFRYIWLSFWIVVGKGVFMLLMVFVSFLSWVIFCVVIRLCLVRCLWRVLIIWVCWLINICCVWNSIVWVCWFLVFKVIKCIVGCIIVFMIVLVFV